MPDVALLAYRARTNDEQAAAGGLSTVGRWPLLDEVAPEWRSWTTGYLLWTKDEPEELALPSAIKFLDLYRPKIVVALGWNTAVALGIPAGGMEMYTGYRTKIGGHKVLVIPMPVPTGRNRVLGDAESRKRLARAFEKLQDPDYVSELLALTGDDDD